MVKVLKLLFSFSMLYPKILGSPPYLRIPVVVVVAEEMQVAEEIKVVLVVLLVNDEEMVVVVAEEMQVAEEMAIVVQEVVKVCCLLSFKYDDR